MQYVLTSNNNRHGTVPTSDFKDLGRGWFSFVQKICICATSKKLGRIHMCSSGNANTDIHTTVLVCIRKVFWLLVFAVLVL